MDIVLGAGIVGTSVALHLAKRGREVVLVDREAPGQGTSFGNAGLIEISDLLPRVFPRAWRELAGYASGLDPRVKFDWARLPAMAPSLFTYWRLSAPKHLDEIAVDIAPLYKASLTAHLELAVEAGSAHLFRDDGWLQLFRSGKIPKSAQDNLARAHDAGMRGEIIAADEIGRREPALKTRIERAIHWRDGASLSDPGELTRLYAERFKALGGTIAKAGVTGIARDGLGWRLKCADGDISGDTLVVALGPWTNDLTAGLGYRFPLLIKRGYHVHYEIADADRPVLPVIDVQAGIVLSPMTRGVRMTTAIEFAARDAKPSPDQVERAAPAAHQLLTLGARIDQEPWMGCRPCTPDMKPIVGPSVRHKGLWFATGHGHHGLTLGAVTGKILAEAMTGEAPVATLEPFSPDRFG